MSKNLIAFQFNHFRVSLLQDNNAGEEERTDSGKNRGMKQFVEQK